MSEKSKMLLEVVGPLLGGILLGSLVFSGLYQDAFYYQCVEEDEERVDDFQDDRIREVQSAKDGEVCYAAPLDEDE